MLTNIQKYFFPRLFITYGELLTAVHTGEKNDSRLPGNTIVAFSSLRQYSLLPFKGRLTSINLLNFLQSLGLKGPTALYY